jgi:fatty acid desaturase
MNPFLSFLYSNMNYHIERHMFPMAPFYRLLELHSLIKADCAPTYSSLWAAYREIIPALLRRRRDPARFARRESLSRASCAWTRRTFNCSYTWCRRARSRA